MVSMLRPFGKGLMWGSGRGRSSEFEGVGCNDESRELAVEGSRGGGGVLRRRRALVKDPLRVALMAAWMGFMGER